MLREVNKTTMRLNELPFTKIARVIPDFYPYVTGPANQAFQISKRLISSGIESTIFTSDYQAQDSPRHERINGIEVERLEISRKFMQYRVTPSLMQKLVNYDPSIIHAHSYRSYQTQCAHNYSLKANKPFVVSMHGSAQGYKYLVGSRIRRLPYSVYDKFLGLKQLRKASVIIVNTSQEESELRVLLENDLPKVVTIPIGVEPKNTAERSGDGQNILFVARITRGRDPKVVIKALRNVVKEFPRAHLNIVGGEAVGSSAVPGGVLQEAQILTRELGLEKDVSFLGELHGDSLNSAYESADIFVYQSLYENFGQCILEAASWGLPVISTNTGVARDLIIDGENGFLVPPAENEEIFAEKIKLLLINSNLRLQFSNRIKSKVKRNYDWNAIIDRYENLYRQLI